MPKGSVQDIVALLWQLANPAKRAPTQSHFVCWFFSALQTPRALREMYSRGIVKEVLQTLPFLAVSTLPESFSIYLHPTEQGRILATQ